MACVIITSFPGQILTEQIYILYIYIYTFFRGGYFRKVFVGDAHGDKVVMKLAAVTGPNRPLAKYDWDSNRLEAVVNNALSPNPHIVDLYSYCGLSLLSENMELGDLHDHASPHYERCKEEDEDLPDDPWELRNNLGPWEKVELALQMAEALRVLHHHNGGTIVHNDVQLAQFLRDKNGKVKLTDFNMATILQYNSDRPEEPCKYIFEKTPGMVSMITDSSLAGFLLTIPVYHSVYTI